SEHWRRANEFFASIGVEVTAVMTDNGSCYRSRAFAEAVGESVKHRKTKPYRPQCSEAAFGSTCVTKWCVTSQHRGHRISLLQRHSISELCTHLPALAPQPVSVRRTPPASPPDGSRTLLSSTTLVPRKQVGSAAISLASP